MTILVSSDFLTLPVPCIEIHEGLSRYLNETGNNL